MSLPHRISAEQFNKLKVSRGALSLKANKYSVSDPSQRTYGGRLYASKAEMAKAQELDMLVNAGIVERWDAQVRYPLHAPNKKRVGFYVLDFRVHYTDGRIEHIDVKGAETAMFRWKRKHWEAETGLKLIVVKR
jgi:hypothetical protein